MTSTTRFPEPRALSDAERRHPLAESGWKAVGSTVFEGEVDTLLIEKNGTHRMVELYEEYAWARDRRRLVWEDFLRLETEAGDRRGWVEALREKLDAYGHSVPNPRVWVARNEDYGADWVLAVEF